MITKLKPIASCLCFMYKALVTCNIYQAALVLPYCLAYFCSDVELTPWVCATELLLKPFTLCISSKGHVHQLATKATKFNFKSRRKKTVIMFVLNSGSRIQLNKMKLNSHRSLQCCSIHSGVISITFIKPEMKLRQMNTLKSHEETFTRILTSRGN